MQKPCVVMLLVIFFTGCALLEMKKDNQALQQRIETKEIQLGELESQNQKLQEKEQLLLKKLESNQLNLDQLKKELAELIKENKRLARLKKRRRQNVNTVEQSINNMISSQARIAQLEQDGDLVSEKQKEIKALKEEIRKYLTIGLKSKYRPEKN